MLLGTQGIVQKLHWRKRSAEDAPGRPSAAPPDRLETPEASSQYQRTRATSEVYRVRGVITSRKAQRRCVFDISSTHKPSSRRVLSPIRHPGDRIWHTYKDGHASRCLIRCDRYYAQKNAGHRRLIGNDPHSFLRQDLISLRQLRRKLLIDLRPLLQIGQFPHR